MEGAQGKRRRTRTLRADGGIELATADGVVAAPDGDGVCCFAMHFRPDREGDLDTMRLRAMVECLSVDCLLSVAWGEDSYPGFAPCDFKSDIRADVLAACHRCKVVCLDYFYLPGTYYQSNYGTNWVSRKVPLLLQGDVMCVILPYDRLGEQRQVGSWDSTGSLREQILGGGGNIDAELCFFDMSWAEALEMHPLVKASAAACTPCAASGSRGGAVQVSESARELYLRSERAFAVFHVAPKEEVVCALRCLCGRRGEGGGVGAGAASLALHHGATPATALGTGSPGGTRHVSSDGPGGARGKGRAREGDGGEGGEGKRRRLASPRAGDASPTRGHVPILRGAAGP